MKGSAGIVASRGVYAGRYYWEVTVQGRCAYIGLGDENYNTAVAPGLDSHSWSLGDVQSVGFIFANSTSLGKTSSPWFGSSSSVTVGIAVDVSAGKIWFRKGSEWVGGAPATGTASAVIKTDFQFLYPIFGYAHSDDYCSVALPTITANFGGKPFVNPSPHGFTRLQTNDCDCSEAYKACFEEIGCSDSQLYAAANQIYRDSCNAGNCTIQSKIDCKESYILCQSSLADSVTCISSDLGCPSRTECDCLRGWYDCMMSQNCSLSNSDFQDYRAACYSLGCYQTCHSTFQAPCDVSTPHCMSNYISCQAQAVGRYGFCGCLSDLYRCIEGNMCWNSSDLIQYASLCVDRNCSESECGFSPLISDELKYLWCTTSVKNACQSIFSDCLSQYSLSTIGHYDVSQDRCYTNYNLSNIPIDERLRGPQYCQDITKRGIPGCLYNADLDICYTAPTCSCVGSFYNCMDSGRCIGNIDRDSYASTCDQIGCTASQCGLGFSICNETSVLVCSSKFLQCETNVQRYGPLMSALVGQNTINATCFSAFCLGHWAQCLSSSNCSSPVSLTSSTSLNLQQCSSILGCSLQGCNVSLAPDFPALPDSPTDLHLTSVLGGKLLVTWLDSYLAVKWVLSDSLNSLISYEVVLSELSGPSSNIIEKVIIDFGSQNELTFDGLTVGTIYTVSVSARNSFGKGPIISALVRLNGPPSVPLMFTAFRSGALRANISWMPPIDFGDTTQTTPLSFYALLIHVTPQRSYNLPFDVDLSVTGLVISFGSEDIPKNEAPLMAGDTISASVAAVNTLAKGPYTPVANVRLMGFPSSIASLTSSETLIGINVSWTLPLDTGFGFADASLILKYYIQISSVVDFDPANQSTALISATACMFSTCSFLIDSSHYSFVEETVYYLRIFAANEIGYVINNAAIVIMQGWRLRSPPTVPQNVMLYRRPNVPLQVELTWSTPLNTGDGTQAYSRFAGYVVQVAVLSSGGLSYQTYLGSEVTLLDIGVLQIGDTSGGATAVLAIPVVGGSIVQVRIAARNDRGSSDFVTPQSIMMMGIPSAVQTPTALEQNVGILVTWKTPLDTGFGTAGRVQTSQYEITVCSGSCQSFRVDQYFASSPNELSFDVSYSYLIGSSILGIQGIKYFINIYAWNNVGKGLSVCPTFCPGQNPGLGIEVGWKILPSIQSPVINALNQLQVAEYGTTTTIWEIQSGLNFTMIPIVVSSFPLLPVSTILLTPVSKGALVLNGRATVNSVITDLMTNKEDPTGLDDILTFGFQAPFFGTGAGSANGVISVASYPTKIVNVPMNYFIYPNTQLIQISPSSGPTSGGFIVALMFYEPLGFKTKVGAGIETIYNANIQKIGVTVQGASATLISRQSNPSGLVYNVYVLISMPPGDSSILSTIAFSVSGSPLTVSAQFQYRNAYIVLVSPAVGLTTGNFFITITVGGVSGANQFTGNATVQILGALCLGSKIASVNSVVVGGLSDTQVVVTATTPAFLLSSTLLPGQGFVTNILVSILRNDGSSLNVVGSNVLQLFVPNTPVISNFIVEASSNKVSFFQPTLISIQINFLRIYPGQMLQVLFGYPQFNFTGKLADCAQLVCPCANPCCVFQGGLQDNYVSTISVYTPIIVAFQPYVSLGVSIFLSGKLVVFGKSIQFFDPGAAQIITVQPSEVRGSGGTILLAGVSGFCPTACPPSGFNVTFNGIAGNVIGFISLTSWLTMDGYASALLSNPLLADVDAGYRASDLRVVKEMQSFLAGNPEIDSNTLYLVYVSNPSLYNAAVVTMSLKSVSDTSRISSFTISNVPDPSGPATGTISPTQVLLTSLEQYNVGFTIFLLPFRLVYSNNEISIYLLSADGLEKSMVPNNFISITSSTSSGTFLLLTLPQCPNGILQCTGGTLNIQIYPTSLPSNVALFTFQVLDQISTMNPVPSTVYTAGNDLIGVVLTQFYVKNAQASDFRVRISSGDGIVRQGQTPCSSNNLVSGSCSFLANVSSVTSNFQAKTTTVSFLAPQIPDVQGKGPSSNSNGVASAQITYVPTGQTSAPISYVYIQTPQGAATILELLPSQGSTLGNFDIDLKLSNFRKVRNISDLSVRFGTGTNLSAYKAATVQSSGFLSDFTITSFAITAPPFPPGLVTIIIVNAGRIENEGSANFLYIDYSVAVLSYPSGPPWPQGDASVANTLLIGVAGLGSQVQASSVKLSISGSPMILSQKVVLQYLISSSTSTQLQLLLPPVPNINSTFLAQISVFFALANTNKSVVLFYQYLPNNTPFVVSFSPADYYTDGGIPMVIEAANLPIPSIQTSMQIMFGAGIVVNATSITSLPILNHVSIALIIPSCPIVEAVTPQIIIVQNATSFLVPFPSTFAFTSPPQVTILSFFPTTGAVRNAVQLSISLSNFPGVSPSRLSDIVIQFGTSLQDGTIISYSRADLSMPIMAVQDIVVLVTTPIVATPESVYITAFHRSFEYRSAISGTQFSFYDPSLPSFLDITSGISGQDTSKIYVKSSSTGRVVITIQNVPLLDVQGFATTSNDIPIFLRGSLIVPASFQISSSGLVIIVIQVPASPPQDVPVTVEFGQSNSTNFADIPVDFQLIFTLRYYADTAPILNFILPSTGSELGGNIVVLSLSNFPTVTAFQDVLVEIDSGSITPSFANVVDIKSSDQTATVLSVQMPAVPVQSGFLDVQVSVFSLIYENQATGSITFRYLNVIPSISSVSPTSGTSKGGTTVNVQIINFPSNLLPLRVTYQTSTTTQDLQMGAGITSITANALGNSVYISLITPASDVGMAMVMIYSLINGPSQEVTFNFQVADASSPLLDVPLPSSACLQDAGKDIFIYAKQATSPQALYAISKQNATVQFGQSTPVMIDGLVQISSGRVRLSVPIPTYKAPVSMNLYVAIGVYTLSQAIPFSILDCSIPAIISVKPSSVLFYGGSLITVALQNIPSLSSNQFAVLFGDQSQVDATSVIASKNAISALTYLIISAPPLVNTVGNINVTISYQSVVLKFLISVQLPCDFNALCSQSGQLVAVNVLQSNPPLSQACLASYSTTYCIKSQNIPTPNLVSFSPSQGLIGVAQAVQVQISAFSSLLMNQNFVFQVLSAISIQAVINGQNRECPLLSFQNEGSTFFSQISSLTFSLPADTDIQEGTYQILMTASYGTTGTPTSNLILRSVTSYYTFLRAVSGPITIQDFYPNQCIPEDCLSTMFTVELGNFPYYQMSLPYDPSKIDLLIQGVSGSALSVVSSSKSATVLLFTLPAGVRFLSNTTIPIYVLYDSYAKQVSRCSVLSSNLCLDNAAIASLIVLPPLIPEVFDLYPDTLKYGADPEDLLVYLSVGYVPRGLDTSDWRAQLFWIQANSTQTQVNIIVVEAVDISDPSCTSDSCSISSIILLAPSEITSPSNQGTIKVCLKASPTTCVSTVLSYSQYIVQIDPTSVEIITDFDPDNYLDVFIDGFDYLLSMGCTDVNCSLPNPDNPCSCSKLRISCNLVTDCDVQPQINSFENGDTFYMSLALPRPKRLGLITFSLYDESDPQKPPVSFQVDYLQPGPVILPSDGPSGTTDTITVIAYWGRVETPIMANVFGGGSFAVSATSIFDTYSIMSLSIPPAMTVSAGILNITLISADKVFSSFNFEVFAAPIVLSLQPSEGSVDGSVGDCAACLTDNDGKTVSIWIQNFPYVEDDDYESITVNFGQLLCDGSETADGSCEISNIQTLFDPVSGEQLVYVAVSVPVAPSGLPTTVNVYVEYIPPDVDTASIRVASSVFTYISPSIIFNWVAICSVCSSTGPCMIGGECGDGSAPIITTLTYPVLSIPQQGGVTAIVSIQNFPQFQINATTNMMVVSTSCTLSDLCGLTLNPPSFGFVKQALISSFNSAILEIGFLGGSGQSLDASIRVRSNPGNQFSTAAFTINYYDSSIQVNMLTSEGPYNGGYQVGISVSGFITLDSAAGTVDNVMTLTFGDQIAYGVEVSNLQNDGQQYDLIVSVPPFSCVACTVSGGSVQVPVVIQAIGDDLLSASTIFVYVQAPQISSARFNLAGTGLEITFNEDTDRAGAGFKVTPCNSILNTSLLGTDSSCLWSSNSLLLASFGNNPSIVPGNLVSVQANSLRSLRSISSYSVPKDVIVLSPLIIQQPSPISITGPSEIDSCSSLVLAVSVPSPRPLRYYWSCADSVALSRLLQGFGSSVYISNVTLSQPGFSTWSDKIFTISVYAVDFLGSKSSVVSIQIKRKSTPSPQISFFGNSIYSAQQDILLRGEAVFSSCAGAAQLQLVFQWTSVSGQNFQTIDFNRLNIRTDSPQLYIPSSTLTAGKQYSVVLTVSISNDKSKTSQKSFTFSTSQSALIAKIAGGSSLYVSASSAWKLDGSTSEDPDKEPSNLTFAWKCSFNNGNGLTQSCSDSNGKLILIPSTAAVSFGPGTFQPSLFPYLFTLTVSKPKRTSGSASVSVLVTALLIPQIGIQQNFSAWSSLGVPQVLSSDKIRLAGYSSDSEIAQFSWSLQSQNTTIFLPAIAVPLGYSNMNFVLNVAFGNLVPGITYTIILRGTASISNTVGTASIQFQLVQPPQSGSCTTCKYVPGTSGCITNGTALVDLFRVSCNGWADTNQPLTYRFGLRTSQGDSWFDSIPDSYKDLRLSTGKITVLAVVINALGSSTDILTSQVLISSISAGSRRALSPAYTAALNQVVSAVATAYLTGRADVVNQISFSFASELDSAFNSSRINSMDSALYKQNLTLYILQSMSIVILTVGYAEETSSSISNVVRNPSQLTETSFISSVQVVNRISYVDTKGKSMSTTLVGNVIGVIDSTTCSLIKDCGNGTLLSEISFTKIWQWMNSTRDTSSRVMLGLLIEVFNGEPASTFIGSSSNFSSAKANLNVLQLYGVGDSQSFTLPAGDTITVNAFSSFSLISNVMRSRFNISSLIFAGLSLSVPLGNLQGASKYVTISIPIDPLVITSNPPNQGINQNSFLCAWWDGTTGKMSSSGCKTSSVNSTMVQCVCNHLTEFALIDTGNRSLVKSSLCNVSCQNGQCIGGAYCSCNINWFGASCSIQISSAQVASLALSFIGNISQPLFVALSSGESLIIPEGAVDPAQWALYGVSDITLASYLVSSLPVTVNQSLGTQQSFAGSFVMVFPSGLQFKIPVALNLQANLPIPVQKNISIFYYDERIDLWDIRQSSLTSLTGIISTSLLHFSTYAVLAFTGVPISKTISLTSATAPQSFQTTALITPAVTMLTATPSPGSSSSGENATSPPSSTPSPGPGPVSLIPIIAGVVGGVVFLAAVVAFFVIRRRNSRTVQVRYLNQQDFSCVMRSRNSRLFYSYLAWGLLPEFDSIQCSSQLFVHSLVLQKYC